MLLKTGDQFVFDILYQQLSNAQNIEVILCIISFFSHHLTINENQSDDLHMNVKLEILFENIKPLLTHQDLQVQKVTNKIYTEFLSSFVDSRKSDESKYSQNRTKNPASLNTNDKVSGFISKNQIQKRQLSISNDNLNINDDFDENNSSLNKNHRLISPKLISVSFRRRICEIETILIDEINNQGEKSIKSDEFSC